MGSRTRAAAHLVLSVPHSFKSDGRSGRWEPLVPVRLPGAVQRSVEVRRCSLPQMPGFASLPPAPRRGPRRASRPAVHPCVRASARACALMGVCASCVRAYHVCVCVRACVRVHVCVYACVCMYLCLYVCSNVGMFAGHGLPPALSGGMLICRSCHRPLCLLVTERCQHRCLSHVRQPTTSKNTLLLPS